MRVEQDHLYARGMSARSRSTPWVRYVSVWRHSRVHVRSSPVSLLLALTCASFASASSLACLTASKRALNLSSKVDDGASGSIHNVRSLGARGAGVVGGAWSIGRRSLLRAREGLACCARSLCCLSRYTMASAACALARPMRAPSSRADAKSIASSSSPLDRGSAYVRFVSVASGVGAPELRISEGVCCERGRSILTKPVLGFVISTSTGGEVSGV